MKEKLHGMQQCKMFFFFTKQPRKQSCFHGEKKLDGAETSSFYCLSPSVPPRQGLYPPPLLYVKELKIFALFSSHFFN